jgi:hypothetical protein
MRYAILLVNILLCNLHTAPSDLDLRYIQSGPFVSGQRSKVNGLTENWAEKECLLLVAQWARR